MSIKSLALTTVCAMTLNEERAHAYKMFWKGELGAGAQNVPSHPLALQHVSDKTDKLTKKITAVVAVVVVVEIVIVVSCW